MDQLNGKNLENSSRNIEIKAKIYDRTEVIAAAIEISDTKEEIIKQVDVYFHVAKGRLKLRKFQDGASTLVFYDRPDQKGPKLSSYNKVNICAEETPKMEALLKNVHGIRGVVSKSRSLFMAGQTRIHVDEVDNLGSFCELEVVLTPEQQIEDGTKIAHELMAKLGVNETDLLTCSYIDLILEKNKN